jgi:hypothetical protein
MESQGTEEVTRLEKHNRGMKRLVTAVQDLSLGRDLNTIMEIVRTAARTFADDVCLVGVDVGRAG